MEPLLQTWIEEVSKVNEDFSSHRGGEYYHHWFTNVLYCSLGVYFFIRYHENIYWYQISLDTRIILNNRFYPWRCHRGNGGSRPPLMFRPLLRLVQIRWKVSLFMAVLSHVCCNFLLLISKENFSTPTVFGLARPLDSIRYWICKFNVIDSLI